MSNQNTAGGMERTWPSGHTRTRDQSDSKPASADATAETRTPPSNDRRGSTQFSPGPWQQDPRSSTAAAAAAATATQTTSSALDLQSPSTMAYEAQPVPSLHTPPPPPPPPPQQLNELEMQEAPQDGDLDMPHGGGHQDGEQSTVPQQPSQQPLQPSQPLQSPQSPQSPQSSQHQHMPLPSHTLPKGERYQQVLHRMQQRKKQKQPQAQQQQQQQQQQQPPSPSSSRCATAAHSRPEPPVTKATLSELDVGKTIHNPKLRHDINFDSDLHIRPNLDGERGRRKQEQAQQFWDLLAADLQQFVRDPEAFAREHPPADEGWSLPVLLATVRDVLQTLVPARDRAVVDEGLCVPLLLQQFARGVVDLERLAGWLGALLKLHCAPMRDEWVDAMCAELSRGNRRNDVAELVRGLRSLLGLLEAMKLDVANHQIRCLRPLLIEDTVPFEQRFFARKIQSGRMPVDDAAPWYAAAAAAAAADPAAVRLRAAFGGSAAFFYGLSQLVRPSVDRRRIPKTFVFDEDRLLKLRADFYDSLHLELCMRVYETAAAAAAATTAEPRGETFSWPEPDHDHDAPDDDDDPASFDFNTPPSSAANSPRPSRPSSLVFSSHGSTTGSPRSSSSSSSSSSDQALLHDAATAAAASAPRPRSPADWADVRARAQSLYSALLALLASAPPGLPPTLRWADLRPKMAVEIYRALDANPAGPPAPTIDDLEQRLAAAMDPKAPARLEAERALHGRLLTALARRVNEFKNMPNVGLFVVAAGGRLHPAHARPLPTTSSPPPSTTTATTTTTNNNNNNPTATAAAAAAAAMAAASAAAVAARNAGAAGYARRPVDLREDGGLEDMATRLAHLGVLHWRVWSRLVYDPQPDAPSDIATRPIPE